MRLDGKVAVVTGGGSGIGRGIVLAMAREGADVAIPDIQVLNAEKVAGEVKGLGRKVLAMKTDVTSAADVKTMVDRTRETFGKIDILVNNAGAAGPPGMPFTNNTEDDWDRTFTVNTKSVFLTCKAITPYFIERKAGRIVNLWTDFWQKLAAHLAETNPAFKGMTARQVFDKRVGDITPMKREQTPEDIGWAAVFLASEEARNITGQALNVDGGVVMQ